jgi:hypothetical protein
MPVFLPLSFALNRLLSSGKGRQRGQEPRDFDKWCPVWKNMNTPTQVSINNGSDFLPGTFPDRSLHKVIYGRSFFLQHKFLETQRHGAQTKVIKESNPLFMSSRKSFPIYS